MSKKRFTGGLSSLLGENTNDTNNQVTNQPIIDKEEVKESIITNEIEELKKDIPKVGRPKTQFKEITKSSQEGTKPNETRATFIVNEDLLEKLKGIAYWDRILIKDVINTALQDHVDKYIKKNKVINPIPKR